MAPSAPAITAPVGEAAPTGLAVFSVGALTDVRPIEDWHWRRCAGPDEPAIRAYAAVRSTRSARASASFGRSAGRQYMEMARRRAMWPGVALTVVVYSLNMFGDLPGLDPSPSGDAW